MTIGNNSPEDFWQARAACRGQHAYLFFPPNHFERKHEKLQREAAAKAICRTCPVIDDCREYALAIREPHGIWGGLTEAERKEILAKRHIAS
ncbi:MAG: WhiB family transcriptional regulator [Acidimicrobiia bacterium]